MARSKTCASEYLDTYLVPEAASGGEQVPGALSVLSADTAPPDDDDDDEEQEA